MKGKQCRMLLGEDATIANLGADTAHVHALCQGVTLTRFIGLILGPYLEEVGRQNKHPLYLG